MSMNHEQKGIKSAAWDYVSFVEDMIHEKMIELNFTFESSKAYKLKRFTSETLDLSL